LLTEHRPGAPGRAFGGSVAAAEAGRLLGRCVYPPRALWLMLTPFNATILVAAMHSCA
jgi:hypothetical protein